MAKQTKVIISTVGPYAKFGNELVRACVNTGTDYCDLTGEPTWIKKVVENYHEVAKKTGARIVNSCGWDCVPSDMGVLVLTEFIEKVSQSLCLSHPFFRN